MKKFFTLALMFLCTASGLHAQEYNRFNTMDCDADGWLWLNTQGKIDKYVGTINGDDQAVDPAGAIIQMAYADIAPDYPETTADAGVLGYGTDGNLGTQGALKGGIILPPASKLMTYNGGAVVVRMPSCATFAVCVSAPGKVLMQLNASTQTQLSKFGLVVGYSLFKPFARAGITKVTGLENKDNGNTGNRFKSNTPIYAMLRNGTRDTVFIHGFKITTVEPTADGIHEVTFDHAAADVYTVDGIQVAAKVSDDKLAKLKKGIYVVRRGKETRKIAVK